MTDMEKRLFALIDEYYRNAFQPTDRKLTAFLIANGVVVREKGEWGNPVKVYADRIRAMSDEELARFAADRNANETYMRLMYDRYSPGETTMKAVREILYCKYLYWLKQPVKDGEGE